MPVGFGKFISSITNIFDTITNITDINPPSPLSPLTATIVSVVVTNPTQFYPTGTVTIYDKVTNTNLGQGTLTSGVASITINQIYGVNQLYAYYSGDSGNKSSQSPTQIFTVNSLITTTSIYSSQTNICASQDYSFYAFVTSSVELTGGSAHAYLIDSNQHLISLRSVALTDGYGNIHRPDSNAWQALFTINGGTLPYTHTYTIYVTFAGYQSFLPSSSSLSGAPTINTNTIC